MRHLPTAIPELSTSPRGTAAPGRRPGRFGGARACRARRRGRESREGHPPRGVQGLKTRRARPGTPRADDAIAVQGRANGYCKPRQRRSACRKGWVRRLHWRPGAAGTALPEAAGGIRRRQTRVTAGEPRAAGAEVPLFKACKGRSGGGPRVHRRAQAKAESPPAPTSTASSAGPGLLGWRCRRLGAGGRRPPEGNHGAG